MKYLDIEPDEIQSVDRHGSLPATVHVFDAEQIEAINASLAAGRPLLVRGEPGTGKSQLARAAAGALGRAFIPFTVDARTEARDLRYSVDAVARLAEAQIIGHLDKSDEDPRQRLAAARFATPGPLWWVFDWSGAVRQSKVGKGVEPWAPDGWSENDGAVLLIDELDKADVAVPNGLLEALGQGEFQDPDGRTVSARSDAARPLIIITTNEERTLPDAFVRRCLVLQLEWPTDRDALIDRLLAWGRARFSLREEVLRAAAEMLADDRKKISDRGLCPPGGAEYLDMLRVVATRWPDNTEAQVDALDRIRAFAFSKHPADDRGW